MGRKYLLDQRKTPLVDAVKRFVSWDPTPFFVPSHKMGRSVDPGFKAFIGDSLFRADLSDSRWLDDLHSASSSIKEAQELAADAWGAAKTHFLINGTSGGIIAAICSVCGDGDRIILPRNAHKSAVYGLVASGAEPVYIMPDADIGKGLITSLKPETLERAFEHCTDAKAVFIVSPTYHGALSDTETLGEIAHSRGSVLIADEAHGGHVYFSERLPRGALEQGADIVCQSTHKMSGSLTQSSMLHLGGRASERLDFDSVQANLSLIQTTSPSYILLASLDAARKFMAINGETVLSGVIDALEQARAEIADIQGLEALGAGYEPTRLIISARAIGLDGYALFDILREQYDIECEFADPVWCVCVAGLGTTYEHTKALTKALAEISRQNMPVSVLPLSDIPIPPIPPLRMTPRQAWFAETESIAFDAARGRVSAEMIVPYPPGIPVICPGEMIEQEVHEYLAEQRAKHRRMHNAAGDGLSTIKVIK